MSKWSVTIPTKITPPRNRWERHQDLSDNKRQEVISCFTSKEEAAKSCLHTHTGVQKVCKHRQPGCLRSGYHGPLASKPAGNIWGARRLRVERAREALRARGEERLRAAGWQGPGGFNARLTLRNAINQKRDGEAIWEAGGEGGSRHRGSVSPGFQAEKGLFACKGAGWGGCFMNSMVVQRRENGKVGTKTDLSFLNIVNTILSSPRWYKGWEVRWVGTVSRK